MDGALMDYMEAFRLLNKYGIRSVESTYVSNADDAVKFAGKNSIVLKVLSQKVRQACAHRSWRYIRRNFQRLCAARMPDKEQ